MSDGISDIYNGRNAYIVGSEPVSPEAGNAGATIYRDVEFIIGDNEARPVKHKYRLSLQQMDAKGREWKIIDVQEVPDEQ